MADRGARHLTFVSRTGTDNPAAAKTVKSLEESGVEVLVLRADVTNREKLTEALTKINPAFQIRGVVNAANVLHDRVFLNMSIDAWRQVTDTKVKGCFNLHSILQDTELDFFVMTSSITSTLGSTGQSNYGAGMFLVPIGRLSHFWALKLMLFIRSQLIPGCTGLPPPCSGTPCCRACPSGHLGNRIYLRAPRDRTVNQVKRHVWNPRE